MADVDQFLQRHVQGALEPGEGILGMGLMRRLRPNDDNSHANWEDYLAVATDRRLIVFDTETGGVFTPTAKPIARSPIEWRYEDLSRVAVKPVFGVTTGISLSVGCHPYLGPYADEQLPDEPYGVGRRYDIFASCDGLDGQRAFHGQFPTWLEQRVNAGAFPLPPQKRAWVESKQAERRAEIAAEQQRVLQRAAERDAKIRAGVDAVRSAVQANKSAALSIGSLVVTLLVGLGGIATGTVFVVDAIETLDDASSDEAYERARSKALEADVAKWASDPAGQPPTDCPEKSWPKKRLGGADTRTKCHACVVETAKPVAQSGGWRTFDRGGSFWTCPPPDSYRKDLGDAKRDLRFAEDQQERATIQLVIGAVAALVALLVIPIGLLVRRKLLAPRA